MKSSRGFIPLAALLISGVALLSGIVYNLTHRAAPPTGSTNPVGGLIYYLYGSGVGSSDTSVTLVSFKLPVSSQKLLMTDFGTIGYLTLEPGNSSRQEYVSFTGVTQNTDGTATLTGVVRGLAQISPYTASSTLQKPHAGGTTAVISNPPQLYNFFANKNNAETIYGVWTLSSTSLPKLDYNPSATTWTSSASTTFATKGYVDDTNNTGASNANETTAGLVQLAYPIQAASSTSSGSTGARLALPASIATSTCQVATSSVLTLQTNGKVYQGCLDQTFGYTWSGVNIFSGGWLTTASSTHTATTSIKASNVNSNALILNGLAYSFPTVRAASSTVFAQDANGNVTLEPQGMQTLVINSNVAQNTTSNAATTTLYEYAMPASTFGVNKMVKAMSTWVTTPITGNACWIQIDFGNGTATSTMGYMQVLAHGVPNSAGVDLYATSTTGTYGTFLPFTDEPVGAAGTQVPSWSGTGSTGAAGGFSSANLAAITYIDFRARVASGGAATCNLNSVVVQLVQ